MAGLDDDLMNPVDEFRETSMNMANGSNLTHPSIVIEKTEDQSQSILSTSTETNQKTSSQ